MKVLFIGGTGGISTVCTQRADLTENPKMLLEERVSLLRTLDEIREPWNLRNPSDLSDRGQDQGMGSFLSPDDCCPLSENQTLTLSPKSYCLMRKQICYGRACTRRTMGK